jgi:hypothetical protein
MNIKIEENGNLNNFDDGLGDGCGGTLCIVASGNDPIEQLATLTELHDDVYSIVILIGILESDDVWMLWKVLHDLHLPLHVIDIHRSPQLLLRYRFASEGISGFPVRTQIRDAKLAAAQLSTQLVAGLDLTTRRVFQDPELVVGVGPPNTIVDGEGVWFLLVLVSDVVAVVFLGNRWGDATITHGLNKKSDDGREEERRRDIRGERERERLKRRILTRERQHEKIIMNLL